MPFQQAIVESPGIPLIASPSIQEQQFESFLSLLHVSSIEEARQLPTNDIQTANYLAIALAKYGSFEFSPTVDGNFVPAVPSTLLRNGQFDKSVRLLNIHTSNEGYGWASPNIQDDAAFRAFVLGFFPGLATSPENLDYITTSLYPSIFNGSQANNYTDQYARAAALVTEAEFTCSVAALGDALPSQTWSADFVLGGAFHETEAGYTAYGSLYPTNMTAFDATSGDLSMEQISYVLQGYFARFTQVGNPNGPELPFWPLYGDNQTAQFVNTSGFSLGTELAANRRCDWWSKGLVY